MKYGSHPPHLVFQHGVGQRTARTAVTLLLNLFGFSFDFQPTALELLCLEFELLFDFGAKVPVQVLRVIPFVNFDALRNV